MAKLTQAQLVELLTQAKKDGLDTGDANKNATKAHSDAQAVIDAKAYPVAVANIRLLNSVLNATDPLDAFTRLLADGKFQKFGKCRLDVRFDGAGGCDPVASKYSARSGLATTSSNGSTVKPFTVGSWPESITFTNNTKEITQAMVVKTVARLYAVNIESKENWPGRNISWSKHSTQGKWALLITGPVVKNGVEKSKDGQTTVGAMVTFTDQTKPAMLLTDWLTAQVAAYKATQATT
jgi:hypothetical protein